MVMKDVIHLFNSTQEKAVEIKNKRAYIDQRTVEQKFNKITEQISREKEMQIDPDKAYKKGIIGEQNEKYQEVIDRKMPFINELLSEIVPVAAGNVYLIGGPTGGGKSTTVANIIIPILDAGYKVLVVTNEERRSDVYSRVACRRIGQSFFKLKKGMLHSETRKLVNEECGKLEDIMTVVGTDFQDNPDLVCTPEGLKLVFEHFAPGHDIILFDYYQNITISRQNDDPAPWVHQATFSTYLNIFKNSFNGPIFVMSQLMDNQKGNATFKERIEGRKSIANIAPVHIELRPNKDDFTTLFHVWKDRLTSLDNYRMLMGFDKDNGRYVVIDDEFRVKQAKWIAERTSVEMATNKQVEDALKVGEMVDKLTSEGDGQPKDGTEDELNFDDIT